MSIRQMPSDCETPVAWHIAEAQRLTRLEGRWWNRLVGQSFQSDIKSHVEMAETMARIGFK